MKKTLLFLVLGICICLVGKVHAAASVNQVRANIRQMYQGLLQAERDYHNATHHKNAPTTTTTTRQAQAQQQPPAWMLQPPKITGANAKLKEGIWKNVARKFGAIIQDVRVNLNRATGFTISTPEQRFALREETLENAMKNVTTCHSILQNQMENLGILQTLSEMLYAEFGSLESVILHLGTKNSQIKINTNYQALIFNGSRNLFFLKQKAGAETLAQLWQTIDPMILYIPKTNTFEYLARDFIVFALKNLQKHQHVQASLCILHCFSSTVQACLKCTGGVK